MSRPRRGTPADDAYLDLQSQARRTGRPTQELLQAIAAVASHRNATIRPLGEVLDRYAELGQSRWLRWRRRSNSDHLPEQFASVLAIVIGFSDPVLTGGAAGKVWSVERDAWA